MSVLGIDIGGTKILACRISDQAIVASERVDTPHEAQGFAAALSRIVRSIWSDDITGVGVGIPGFIYDNKLYHSPNLAFLEEIEDITSFLNNAIGMQATYENDANCFALAEHQMGAGRGCKHMLGIILGTGVGAGIIINNELYVGAANGAGEVGDMRLHQGCWMDHISGPAIMKYYASLGGTSAAHPGEVWNSTEQAAVQTRAQFLEHLGKFLASVINVFNPECIVLGGSVSQLPFYDQLSEYITPYCAAAAYDTCQIVPHKISADAGALGAAFLVEKEKEKK